MPPKLTTEELQQLAALLPKKYKYLFFLVLKVSKSQLLFFVLFVLFYFFTKLFFFNHAYLFILHGLPSPASVYSL